MIEVTAEQVAAFRARNLREGKVEMPPTLTAEDEAILVALKEAAVDNPSSVTRHVKVPRGRDFTIRFEFKSPGDPGYISFDEAQDVFADIVGRSLVKRAKEILAGRDNGLAEKS